MIVPGSVNPLLLATGGYEIPYSLRFRRANSAYLSRTMGTPTNDKICTWSFWAKRGTLGTTAGELLFHSSAATGGGITIFFDSVSPNAFRMYTASGTRSVTSSSVFRDTSAWYHFVIAYDSTETTSSNRFKVWVNNQSLSFTGSFPDSNHACSWNVSGSTSYFGSAGGPFADSRDYIDGYRAECYFIDGQALTPSSFGQTDSATGVWIPKKYSGTYGTNGFYLKFADASAATATAIGKDSSGNGNNWTPSGISVTSGVTFDQSTDTPTLGYPVISPINSQATVTISEANMASNYGGASNTGTALVSIPFPTTGKWYYEHTCIALGSFDYFAGVMLNRSIAGNVGNIVVPGTSANEYAYRFNGEKMIAGVTSAYGSSYTANDVIGVAFDADNLTIQFYKNNVAQGLISSMPAGQYVAFTLQYGGGSTKINFGQRPFSYTPPTGFKALNTTNLPTPSIKKGSLYMDATLRTGTGATASVSSLGFQPDLVWIKSRSAATDHGLYDAVRGVQKQLESNTITAETTETTGLTAFNSNGYTVGALAQLNTSAATYVDWAWKEGVTPGFDIVTWTANGTSPRNISHSLGAVPKFIITKQRSPSADNWFTYHASLGATKNVRLDETVAAQTQVGAWNNTEPTSTQFTTGSFANFTTNGNTLVAYLWSEIEGFSKFGSYTGNGSTDGPFVWCGAKVRWLMVKRSDTSGSWVVIDAARAPFNEANARVFAELPDAEVATTAVGFDFLASGFKARQTNANINASGGTYIFAAFAENPFKYARAR